MVLLQGTIAPATPESGQGGNPCQGDLDSLAVFRKMASGTSFGSGRMSQGQEKRQRVWEKICPSSGPGKLSASERERKAKEFIAASGVDTEGYFNNVVKQTNHSGVTFRGQAETWLESMRNRDSEPLAPSTLAPWSYALDKWINPNIGDMPLASVKNTAMKDLVAKMKAGLPPKSVINYAQIVKMVVASAINEEGEQLYPQKWNHKFIGMPVVNKKKQNTPSFTGEVLTAVLVATEEKKYRVLFALCASTGLRFGEALGIDIKNISPTAPQSRLSRKHGVRHPVLKKLAQPKCGIHAFRRFRNTYLRNKTLTPPGIYKFWMGHAGEGMSDLYDKIKNETMFRKQMAEKAGLGFELPSKIFVIGRNGRKLENSPLEKVAATA